MRLQKLPCCPGTFDMSVELLAPRGGRLAVEERRGERRFRVQLQHQLVLVSGQRPEVQGRLMHSAKDSRFLTLNKGWP